MHFKVTLTTIFNEYPGIFGGQNKAIVKSTRISRPGLWLLSLTNNDWEYGMVK